MYFNKVKKYVHELPYVYIGSSSFFFISITHFPSLGDSDRVRVKNSDRDRVLISKYFDGSRLPSMLKR